MEVLEMARCMVAWIVIVLVFFTVFSLFCGINNEYNQNKYREDLEQRVRELFK